MQTGTVLIMDQLLPLPQEPTNVTFTYGSIVEPDAVHSISPNTGYGQTFEELLHQSMAIQMVLKVCFEEFQDALDIHHLHFRSALTDQEWSFGHPSAKPLFESAHYLIETDTENLGILTLSRHKALTDYQHQKLCQKLQIAIYPLRNALLYERACQQAKTDPLTLCGNRTALDETLADHWNTLSRYGFPFSVLMVDIDHFKSINDTYGHTAGDHVIRTMAELLKQTLRCSDKAFRYGGEEFLILLPHTDLNQSIITAERIRHAIEAHIFFVDEQTRIEASVSIGIATAAESKRSYKDLIDAADQALYAAKANGRNRVEVEITNS